MSIPDRADAAVEETPSVVRDRAIALVEYLLAVRALVEKPVRTVPATDAYWIEGLPEHPACEVGPLRAGGSWLRIGRPGPPEPPPIPPGLVRHLVWDLSWQVTPRLADESDEHRRAALAGWLDAQWQPWAERAQVAATVRGLHDRLYDLRYRLDIEASRLELVWGHLIVDGSIGGERVRYPLIATPVAIEYDPESGTVRVAPQGPVRLQPDALGGLDDRRVADLLDLGGAGGQVDVDPWDEQERRELAGRAMRRLGLDPVIRPPEEPTPPGGVGVRDSAVLFVRPRQRMVRRFLAQMRDRLVAAGRGGEAGAAAASVGALAGVLAHEPSRLRLPDDQPAAWERVGARLLMPMATNEAQESIARRLAVHRNVVVQGPPGTGKTHTIRNLICHLVAHGKRVLVLAQKEDPLRVLRDGLPAEIQPLSLAILGRSVDQLVQLQISARELSDRAATLDRAAERSYVERLAAEIARTGAEFHRAQDGLRAAAERESGTYPLAGGSATASEVAEWLRRREPADGFVPDVIAPEVDPPLDAAEFGALLDLARRLPLVDRVAALADLPADGELPSGEALAARRAALAEAEKAVDSLRDRGLAVDAARRLGPGAVAELGAALRAAADALARRKGSWTDRLGRLVAQDTWRGVWAEHAAATARTLEELARRATALAGHVVVVPPEAAAQPRMLLARLGELRSRFAAGRRPNRLTQGELYRLAAESTVDGEPLRAVADVDLVVAQVERGQLRQRLAARWAEWAQRLDAPLPGGDPELWAGQVLAEAVDALEWESRRWPELHATLASLHPAGPRTVDAHQLGELAAFVAAAENVFRVDDLAYELDHLADRLHAAAGDRAAAPVLRHLVAAWDAADDVAWDAALAEIRRLWNLRPAALRYADLHARLGAVAPRLAAAIDTGSLGSDASGAVEPRAVEPRAVEPRAGAVPVLGGDDLLRGWRWRQAQTWFEQTVLAVDPVAIGRRVERLRDRITQLTGDLVVGSAWLEVSLTLDDRRRAALADWTAALRKIGKGTGRSAAHWQAAAQRAMADAVAAVPVWIMSIDRALEQFTGGEPVFDVVIVDEASQADLFALPVLSLARRAVVVGDDQQIGPQLVGVPTDRVTALINAHLVAGGVPSAPYFDTESSLYDHAVRRSPERILLTEHFRCVPSIIEFSSATYYDNRIQPLRADAPAGIGAPVHAVHVADGRRRALPEYGEVNVEEAEALVTRVAAIVADPAYEGRTIGVVSLLSGSGQAAYLQHRLRAEIGPRELARRDLRVGDPYTFQGDERDVVLVSLVVSADGDFGAFTKRDYHRRVNVAASRARDQLWLFHSVTLADLHPDDARAILLAHYLKPPAPAEVGAAPEGDFRRAVLRRLRERGLSPVPGFRVGRYRIDFVLTAPDGRRLAIECDGDRYAGAGAFAQELRRQAILERVGNCVFVRLAASRFARDPDAAMRPVWERAEELAIPRTT
ncbi:AAA domain-containing protein [Rhizomonospora bruguierae]|uniref:AAA domain-containing protein n=1 Tax=Rhizomonospora bruguierae TaxID=1581705 RepID=UPI0020BE784B|nr:AAA domain-containing protein [Micromonospora sp. NBRC 107566]